MSLLSRNTISLGAKVQTTCAPVEAEVFSLQANPLDPSWEPPICKTPYALAAYYVEEIKRHSYRNGEVGQAHLGDDPLKYTRPAKKLLAVYTPEMAVRLIKWGLGWSKNGSPALWRIVGEWRPKFEERWEKNTQFELGV